MNLCINYINYCFILLRDLKPENLLLGYFDEIKLADFGWSFRLATNTKEKCIAGTIDYLCKLSELKCYLIH